LTGSERQIRSTSAQKPLLRSIDSHRRTHKMLPRAALKRRPFCFSLPGLRSDSANARIVA
jgi:hypothetical protein